MIAIRFPQYLSFLAYTVLVVIAAIGMLSPSLIYAVDYWSQTPASGMTDVAVSISAQDTKIWLVGKNGTIWFSHDKGGKDFTQHKFTQIEGSGFSRVSVGPDGVVWAVSADGTVSSYSESVAPSITRPQRRWFQTKASGMADVAVSPDGKLWLAGENGTIWFSADQGDTFTQIEASGFRRLSVGSDGVLWAVGSNETLWKFQGGSWTQTAASGMSDVGAGFKKIWLVGKNRTVWTSETGQHFQQDKDANGFASIASGFTGTWAVGSNGTLWRFVPDDLH